MCGVGSRMISVFSFFATDVVHEIDTLRARNHPSLELLLLFVHQLVPPQGRHRRVAFSSNIVSAFYPTLFLILLRPGRIIRVLFPPSSWPTISTTTASRPA